MKKIYLQLTPFFPSTKNFRGSYIYDQVKAIKNNSHYDVIVIKMISCYEKIAVKPYEYQGIKVFPFKVLDLPFAVLPGLLNTVNLVRLNQYIKNVVKIDLHNVDIIHSHVLYPCGQLATELALTSNIRCFIQHHGLDVLQLSNGRLLSGYLKTLNEKFITQKQLKALNLTNLNIGVSQKVIDVLTSLPNFSNNNTTVLHNGVDIEKFHKTYKTKRNHEFVIGCIANFWPIKDQITLLKAISLLNDPSVFVKFIGTGPTLEYCSDYVLKNNLEENVSFLSEIDHHKLNEFYNSLNLFVLPSFYEAFGCVYTEAISVGVPIIAVKEQGINEVIFTEDEYKFLIEKSDFSELAKKIVNIKNNQPNLTNYNFDINRYIKQFLERIS